MLTTGLSIATRLSSATVASLLLVSSSLMTACGGPVGTRDELVAALSSAQPGAIIDVKPGVYDGSFVIPVALTLRGTDAADPPLFTASSGISLRFALDGGEVTLASLAIESAGVAIVGTGATKVTLDGLRIQSGKGVGVVLEDNDAIDVRAVDLTGPVTADNINDLSGAFEGGQTAIAGLVVSRVASTSLTDVAVRGFAGFGAVIVESTGLWQGGSIEGNAGTSLLLERSTFELVNVRVADALKGNDLGGDFIAPTGIVVSRGSVIASDALAIEGIPGLGFVQDDSHSDHVGLLISGVDGAGVWVQNCFGEAGTPSLAVRGSSSINDNRGAAVVVVDSSQIELDTVTLAGSALVSRPLGELGAVQIGDGLQVKGASGNILLRGLTISDNERVGILLDGTAAQQTPAIEMTDVAISAPTQDGAFGLVSQNGIDVDASWGVTRDASLEAQDATAQVLTTIARLPAFPTTGSVGEAGFVGEAGLVGAEGLNEGNDSVGQDGF